jgi:hypothetical protein
MGEMLMTAMYFYGVLLDDDFMYRAADEGRDCDEYWLENAIDGQSVRVVYVGERQERIPVALAYAPSIVTVDCEAVVVGRQSIRVEHEAGAALGRVCQCLGLDGSPDWHLAGGVK